MKYKTEKLDISALLSFLLVIFIITSVYHVATEMWYESYLEEMRSSFYQEEDQKCEASALTFC